MRICILAIFLALGGCGSANVYDDARSASEAAYFLKKGSGLQSDKMLGENPYDNDPNYKMSYCKTNAGQYWTTVAMCQAANKKPKK
jgi:hypothetical protein